MNQQQSMVLMAVALAGFALVLAISTNQSAIADTFTSITNSDGSLTISPAIGNVVASLNVNHVNTWALAAGQQVFNGGILTSGLTTSGNILANAITLNLGDATNYFNNLHINSIIFHGGGADLSGTYALDGTPTFGVTPSLATGVTIPSGVVFSCTIPSGTGLANTASAFYNPQAQCPESTSETQVAIYYPVKGQALNLFVAIQTAPGAGTSWTFALKDGGVTALTCTISGAAATTCSDTTHTVTISSGDVISIKVTQSGAPAASGFCLLSMQIKPEG